METSASKLHRWAAHKGAASFIFCEVLADTKVHHAGCLPGERDETIDKQKDQSEVKGRCRFVLENWKSLSTPGIQGDFFKYCEPFLCGEEEGVFPCVAASSCSCSRLSSSFISLSYSTHSGTILAAAVSLGSFVFGLLHCSKGRGEGADKIHQSQHQCHFLPASHIAIPSTVCGSHLNLI